MNANSNTVGRAGTVVAALLATLLTGTLAVGEAHAQPRDFTVLAPVDASDALTVFVSYADLDLARPAGQLQLERRVGHAVQQVCPSTGPSGLAEARSASVCRATAWNGARPQIDAAIANGGRGYAQARTVAVAARP
jgi:UrcA family protein